MESWWSVWSDLPITSGRTHWMIAVLCGDTHPASVRCVQDSKTPAPPYDLALTVGGLLLQYPCRRADPPPRPRLGLGQVARHSISLNLAPSPSVYTNSPKSQNRPSHRLDGHKGTARWISAASGHSPCHFRYLNR
jgi:hypothetical protein